MSDDIYTGSVLGERIECITRIFQVDIADRHFPGKWQETGITGSQWSLFADALLARVRAGNSRVIPRPSGASQSSDADQSRFWIEAAPGVTAEDIDEWILQAYITTQKQMRGE